MPHLMTLMPFHAPSSFFISHSPLFTNTTGDSCHFNFPVDVTHQTCFVARTWFFYLYLHFPYHSLLTFSFVSLPFLQFFDFSVIFNSITASRIFTASRLQHG